MKILAVEFSSSRRSIALAERKPDGTIVIRAEASEAGGQSVRALTMIEGALREAGWERAAIELIAVGLGPGSYAGVRAAISLAQGWQLARRVQTIGLSSVEGLAESARTSNVLGRVRFAIDAQRNEFYTAIYEIGAPLSRVEEPLRIVPAAQIAEFVRTGDRVMGPEIETAFPGHSQNLFPTAVALATLARPAIGVPAERLEPIYLRETSFVKAPPPLSLPS